MCLSEIIFISLLYVMSRDKDFTSKEKEKIPLINLAVVVVRVYLVYSEVFSSHISFGLNDLMWVKVKFFFPSGKLKKEPHYPISYSISSVRNKNNIIIMNS